MFNQKRGLSDVITTLLIILLAIAAVAILWVFVGPALRGGGVSVKTATDCLDTKIEVTACRVSGNQISILNNAGSSIVTNVIVEDANGVIRSTSKTTTIAAFRSLTVSPTPAIVANDIARAIPIITGTDGKERPCEQQASVQIKCA